MKLIGFIEFDTNKNTKVPDIIDVGERHLSDIIN